MQKNGKKPKSLINKIHIPNYMTFDLFRNTTFRYLFPQIQLTSIVNIYVLRCFEKRRYFFYVIINLPLTLKNSCLLRWRQICVPMVKLDCEQFKGDILFGQNQFWNNRSKDKTTVHCQQTVQFSLALDVPQTRGGCSSPQRKLKGDKMEHAYCLQGKWK